MAILRIRNWGKHFENNRSRELKRCDWIPVPNKLDGDGYTELMDHPNGASHYGAWMALVLVASRCDPRGTLSRDGARHHDSRSLARITRVPAAVFDEAIPRLISIGWLEVLAAETDAAQELALMPHEGAAAPHEGAALAHARGTERKGTERKGTERKGTERKGRNATRSLSETGKPVSDDAAVLAFPVVGGGDERTDLWYLIQSHLDRLSRTYRAVDVAQKVRDLWDWAIANPSRRKTRAGMAAFLTRNLANAQDRARGPGQGSLPGISEKEARGLEATKLWLEET